MKWGLGALPFLFSVQWDLANHPGHKLNMALSKRGRNPLNTTKLCRTDLIDFENWSGQWNPAAYSNPNG